MSRRLLSFFVLFGLVSVAVADNGLVNVKSTHSVKDTADNLEKAFASKGMTIFIRIDHAAGAQKVDLALPPTELVIFGNPKVGTPLIQCILSVAIDLPQKALIWEDGQGQVWLTFNDPVYLATRHAITGCEAVLEKVGGAPRNFAAAATQPWGSRKNKFAILGVETPAWQGVKTPENLDIPSFRNAARRDASASKM